MATAASRRRQQTAGRRTPDAVCASPTGTASRCGGGAAKEVGLPAWAAPWLGETKQPLPGVVRHLMSSGGDEAAGRLGHAAEMPPPTVRAGRVAGAAKTARSVEQETTQRWAEASWRSARLFARARTWYDTPLLPKTLKYSMSTDLICKCPKTCQCHRTDGRRASLACLPCRTVTVSWRASPRRLSIRQRRLLFLALGHGGGQIIGDGPACRQRRALKSTCHARVAVLATAVASLPQTPRSGTARWHWRGRRPRGVVSSCRGRPSDGCARLKSTPVLRAWPHGWALRSGVWGGNTTAAAAMAVASSSSTGRARAPCAPRPARRSVARRPSLASRARAGTAFDPLALALGVASLGLVAAQTTGTAAPGLGRARGW